MDKGIRHIPLWPLHGTFCGLPSNGSHVRLLQTVGLFCSFSFLSFQRYNTWSVVFLFHPAHSRQKCQASGGEGLIIIICLAFCASTDILLNPGIYAVMQEGEAESSPNASGTCEWLLLKVLSGSSRQYSLLRNAHK